MLGFKCKQLYVKIDYKLCINNIIQYYTMLRTQVNNITTGWKIVISKFIDENPVIWEKLEETIQRNSSILMVFLKFIQNKKTYFDVLIILTQKIPRLLFWDKIHITTRTSNWIVFCTRMLKCHHPAKHYERN